MSFTESDGWITTAEAARLTGRPAVAFRGAIDANRITAVKDPDGHWLMPRDEAMAWHAQARRCAMPNRTGQGYRQVAALLQEHGSLDSAEVTALLGIHPGNARKHLAVLAKLGWAQRRADGQWELHQPLQAIA
jgi:hypothetical protein